MRERRVRGFSLVEALIALCVTMCVLPVILDVFGSIFLVAFRIDAYEDRVSGAEWWFNRLGSSVSEASIADMPRADSTGKVHFSWEVRKGEHGSLHIVLRVMDASGPDTPLVLHRVY